MMDDKEKGLAVKQANWMLEEMQRLERKIMDLHCRWCGIIEPTGADVQKRGSERFNPLPLEGIRVEGDEIGKKGEKR